MSRIYIIFFTTILICSFFSPPALSPVAAESNFIKGLEKTAETGAGYGKVDNPMGYIAKIVGSALTPMFIGVTFLIIMLYAGYIWMMARGNEQEVARAKNIIIYAVIGLVAVLAGYAIVKLIMPIWESAIAK